MSALRWDRVRQLFDLDAVGQLPDGWVDGTTVDDWQTALDLATTGWAWECVEHPLPTAVELAARLGPDAETHPVRVEIAPDTWLLLWFLETESIDFDIDVRGWRGQEALDGLCDFLTRLGRALGKSVWLGAEGDSSGTPHLGYDVTLDRMVVLAQW